MPRPKDYQQRRLYNVDKALPDGRSFRTENSIRREIQRIVHSRWWKARFPHVKDVAFDPGTPKDEFGMGDAHYPFNAGSIRLNEDRRCLFYVLHELGHTIVERARYASRWSVHGPQYVGVLLSLLRKFAPDLYPIYRETYSEAGIDWIDLDEVEAMWKEDK